MLLLNQILKEYQCDGLYTKEFSVETATPEAVPDVGVNKT